MPPNVLTQINIVLATLLAIFAGVYVALRFRAYYTTNHKENIKQKVEKFRDSMVYKLGTQQLKDLVSKQFMPPIITRV